MKGFFKVFSMIFPYWKYAVANFVFIILSVLFGLISMALVSPFLGILFGIQDLVYDAVPYDWSMSGIFESLKHNFYYLLSKAVIERGTENALLLVSLFVVIMVFFKTSFHYLANYFMAPLRIGVVRDIRNKIYTKILKLPLGYFSNERKGDIISRMTGDVQEIEVSVVQSFQVIFKEPVTILIYLGTLIYMSAELTLFIGILLPLTGFIIGRIGRTLRAKSLEAQNIMGKLLSMIEETLSGLRIIKAFNAENKISKNFFSENNIYSRVMIKMWRRRDLAIPLSEFLGTLVVVLLMWYGGRLVLDSKSDLSSQDFIVFIIIFSQIIPPAKAFSSAFYNIQKGMASVDRINKILYAENKIQESDNAENKTSFSESIEFKNVSFKYEDEFVLKDINLKIEKGKTIALVGQSGAGKSTLVDLIPRFYDVVDGEILLDEKNIKDLKIKDLRSLMGNVNQESILFNDTIKNNIKFGVEKATDEEIIAAAKVANAHNFIQETEESYETNIGDRGTKLSGGQKQRLSIARAILKNPPILILDEATSALDTESERLVQDALSNLMKNRTSIVIAHRLSTIYQADEICVMQKGKIVERGKHEELINLGGVYKKLHDLQVFAQNQ